MRGQSLLEVIIAVAVGTIAILASITVLTLILRISRQDVSLQTASFLERDLADKLSITAERNWQIIKGLSDGADYYLVPAGGGNFNPVAGREIVIIDGLTYEKFFQIGSVSRNIGGEIVVSGGVDDPSTKKADIFVEWQFGGDTANSSVSRYLTRANNFVIRQTDWSGGVDASDPALTLPKNIFFAASSTIDFDSRPGQIKLKQ